MSLAKSWNQRLTTKKLYSPRKQVLSEMKEFDDIAIYVDPEYYTEVQSHKTNLSSSSNTAPISRYTPMKSAERNVLC
ncbi:hypothetical protein PO124_00785 [Bacillus licheniformis]|nr:hypothetical protein [Bacillus licheniformis]